jgi:hypothetical protein
MLRAGSLVVGKWMERIEVGVSIAGLFDSDF